MSTVWTWFNRTRVGGSTATHRSPSSPHPARWQIRRPCIASTARLVARITNHRLAVRTISCTPISILIRRSISRTSLIKGTHIQSEVITIWIRFNPGQICINYLRQELRHCKIQGATWAKVKSTKQRIILARLQTTSPNVHHLASSSAWWTGRSKLNAKWCRIR